MPQQPPKRLRGKSAPPESKAGNKVRKSALKESKSKGKKSLDEKLRKEAEEAKKAHAAALQLEKQRQKSKNAEKAAKKAKKEKEEEKNQIKTGKKEPEGVKKATKKTEVKEKDVMKVNKNKEAEKAQACEKGNQKAKKKEESIKYEPLIKKKMDHVFRTPETKKQPVQSPTESKVAQEKKRKPSPGASSSTTDKKLQKLQEFLEVAEESEDSESDDESLTGGVEGEAEENGDDESDEEEDEAATEGKEEDVSSESAEEDSESGNDGEAEEEDEAEASEEGTESEAETEEKIETGDKTVEKEGKKKETTEKQQTEARADEAQHALVPVADASTELAVALPAKLRNSTSNKRDWDSFVRSKERFRVYEYYQSNRIELFNLWLDSGKSWDSVALTVERLHKQQHESKKGWITVQGKELKKTHDHEKWLKLVESRKTSGMWFQSEDFPDDDDEAWFYMPAPKEVTHRDITSETTKLSATASVESDLLQALTSEQGFMRPGAMPAVSAATAAGSKAVLDTLGKAVKKNAPAKAKPDKAEELKAETPKDKVNELMEAALKEAGVARTSAISLSGMDYAEDLSKVLLSHVQSVEDLFKDVQVLCKKEGATEKEFKKMIKKVEAKAEGTKKLQAAAKSFLSSKKPKKAKAKKHGAK